MSKSTAAKDSGRTLTKLLRREGWPDALKPALRHYEATGELLDLLYHVELPPDHPDGFASVMFTDSRGDLCVAEIEPDDLLCAADFRRAVFEASGVVIEPRRWGSDDITWSELTAWAISNAEDEP